MALTVIGLGYAAVPFLLSLAPSERARNSATFVLPLPVLEPGRLAILRINERPIFLLRPNEEQTRSIALLDGHVWNASKGNYVRELDAYVYWGTSTKWGCLLQDKPAQDTGMTKKGEWLGGFWDPACEVSYDYAGRTIKTWEFTFNGYTGEFTNLVQPKFKVEGGNLIVSLL
jgi:hypothetical protein